MGFEPAQGEALSAKLTRGLVMEWACELGMEQCVDPANRDLLLWQADPSRQVQSQL